MKSIISGFFIGGEVGQRLADVKELHNSDTVWSYPLFSLSFIDNPAPLLLYDEVLIDQQVAPKTIEYLANVAIGDDTERRDTELSIYSPAEIDRRAKTLELLFSCPIFRHVRFESRLNSEDINTIRDGTQNIIRSRSNWFKDEVEQLKLIYGPHYANPSPLNFEALNTELFWVLSKKFSEDSGDLSIFDDCARGNLYRHKIYSLISRESTKAKVANEFLNSLPKYVVGLPPISLTDTDAFLELHQSPEIIQFREIISAISNERDEHVRTRLVNRELYRANEEAIKRLADSPNSTNKIVLIGLVLAVGVSAAQLLFEPSWVTGFGFASSQLALWAEIKTNWERISRRSNFGWFNQLKSFAEKQSGFYASGVNPWNSPEI